MEGNSLFESVFSKVTILTEKVLNPDIFCASGRFVLTIGFGLEMALFQMLLLFYSFYGALQDVKKKIEN